MPAAAQLIAATRLFTARSPRTPSDSGAQRLALVELLAEPPLHDCAEGAVEVGGNARRKRRALLAIELTSGLQIVRHVQHSSRAIPLGVADRVPEDRVEHARRGALRLPPGARQRPVRAAVTPASRDAARSRAARPRSHRAAHRASVWHRATRRARPRSMSQCVGPRERELRDARDVRPALGRRDPPRRELDLGAGHAARSGAPRMTLSMSRVVPMRAAIAMMLPVVAIGVRLERLGVDHREILEAHRRLGRDRPRFRALRARWSTSRRRRRRRASRRSRARARARASRSGVLRYALRLESATPSLSRTVGATIDANRKIEIAHHRANDRCLLNVLLPEDRDIGLHDVEELRDHGEHAREMSGARRAVPSRCERGRARPTPRARRDRARPAAARRGCRRRALRRGARRLRDRADSARNPRWVRTAAG